MHLAHQRIYGKGKRRFHVRDPVRAGRHLGHFSGRRRITVGLFPALHALRGGDRGDTPGARPQMGSRRRCVAVCCRVGRGVGRAPDSHTRLNANQ